MSEAVKIDHIFSIPHPISFRSINILDLCGTFKSALKNPKHRISFKDSYDSLRFFMISSPTLIYRSFSE